MGRLCSCREGCSSSPGRHSLLSSGCKPAPVLSTPSEAQTCPVYLFLCLSGLHGREAQMRLRPAPVTRYHRREGWLRQGGLKGSFPRRDLLMSLWGAKQPASACPDSREEKLGSGQLAVSLHASLLGQDSDSNHFALHVSCLQTAAPHVLICSQHPPLKPLNSVH